MGDAADVAGVSRQGLLGDGARVLPITAWSVPCLLLVQHNILVFAAANRERLNLVVMSVFFAITAGFQLALVPTYGVVGAAWGLLGSRLVGPRRGRRRIVGHGNIGGHE